MNQKTKIKEVEKMNIRQIRSKQAYIINNTIGISYITPQAISLKGITFITSNWYSITTAHHKTDIIRDFNNSETITINHNTLIDLINNYNGYNHEQQENLINKILEEEKLKNYLIRELKTENSIPNHYKLNKIIERTSSNKTKYNNGNYKTIQTYKTNFQHVDNITFKVTNHHFFKKIKYYSNSITGWTTRQERIKTNKKAVITSY